MWDCASVTRIGSDQAPCWRHGVRKLKDGPDHAWYSEWFKHCLADSAGPCPKRRRLMEGVALQKEEANKSSERFELDLVRLVAFSGAVCTFADVSNPAALADLSPSAALADLVLPERGLKRRHTI